MNRGGVNGDEMLDQVVASVRRFVVLTNPQAVAVALWTVHTHAIEAAQVTPYLVCHVGDEAVRQEPST